MGYLEGDVFVRRTGVEAKDSEAGMIGLLQVVLRGLLAVDQVRIKHVELVSLGQVDAKANVCTRPTSGMGCCPAQPRTPGGLESEHVRQLVV